MSSGQSAFPLPVGRITHSRADIIRIVELLAAKKEPVKALVAGQGSEFVSQILHVDPAGAHIALASSADEAANAALLGQSRCTFFAAPAGWHIEFVATHPKSITYDQAPAIQLQFPEVLVSLQRREHVRASVPREFRLSCTADAGGLLPFVALIYDFGPDGVGLLIYGADITLEPGTLLRGCRIERAGESPIVVDLEVRYSEPDTVRLADGSYAKRSGCRFVNPPPALKVLAERLTADQLEKE